jgi:phosphoglycerate dehydrogenase-like enzyme
VSKLWERSDRSGSRAAAVEDEQGPLVAVAPRSDAPFREAIEEGGGRFTKGKEAEAIVWTDPHDAKALSKLVRKTNPKWVQLPFAGIELFVREKVIDAERIWTCAKGVYGPATAEHALALIMASARRLNDHIGAMGWRYGGFGTPERRLKGSTVLVVGTGGIGSALVPMLLPLGVRVLAANRTGHPLDGAEITEPVQNLVHLVAEADYVVLACALTDETTGMFDATMLDYMKEDAWLVNVARGKLIVTDHLIKALKQGSIGGAALDVTDPEPLPIGHPLWSFENVIITPHVANTWDMALPELRELVARNVAHFAAGEQLEGVVDPEQGY